MVGWAKAERGPGPLQIGGRRHHQLLRYARDRIVRDHAPPSSASGRWCPDRLIPGTLNVGHTLPTVAQAFIYTKLIPVDVLTLVLDDHCGGPWGLAGRRRRVDWSKRKIQVGMGSALLVAATLMLITQIQALTGSRILPLGGEALGVRGVLLLVAVVGNFMLGALMTLGIGLYAPVHDPGQPARHEPHGRLPDHDGLVRVPDASRQPAFHPREAPTACRSALGLAIGGIPGVLVAALIVVSMNLATVRWLVIVVVLYTAVTMLIAAAIEKKSATAAEAVRA